MTIVARGLIGAAPLPDTEDCFGPLLPLGGVGVAMVFYYLKIAEDSRK
jgi:hypothetical protein